MKITVAFLLMVISFNTYSQSSNRLFSRLFYLKPEFHNSKTQFIGTFDSESSFLVNPPIDNRKTYVGEIVTRRIKVEEYDDFWNISLSEIVANKISGDLKSFRLKNENKTPIKIQPIIEVMYTCPRGIIWSKCYSKVRLKFIVTKSEAEILNNTYEATYFTSGTDIEYEGKLTDTIENFANITLGICFRKALDKFYDDLKTKL